MVFYICTKKGYCIGQTVRGRCLARGHPEQKECEYIKIMGTRPSIGMRLITLNLPESYIKALDRLVNEKKYANRADAIRVAVRDLIRVEAWGIKDE